MRTSSVTEIARSLPGQQPTGRLPADGGAGAPPPAELSYPIPETPDFARTLAIAPGILWLRMPLPRNLALDHINLWLIEESDGWTVVDTGIGTAETREVWEQVFAGPMGGRPIRRLLATHYHPDHMGSAGWLCDRFGITLDATLTDWLLARSLSLTSDADYVRGALPFYRSAGADDGLLGMVAQAGNPYAKSVGQVPLQVRRLQHGQTLTLGGRAWHVIVGEGHAPELATLWCPAEKLLISADQILPKISPNISVWSSEPEADNLALYLASMSRFQALPPDTLVLPSHGRPFIGLHRRLEALAGHHRDRLDQTLAACERPATAADLVKVLFRRPLDRHTVFFAIGEALAHLNHLWAAGQLVRETDASGVTRFRRA
jgi:glyoxylase-like metal-dependent hydrolase (beta-lactamase superfamily II)